MPWVLTDNGIITWNDTVKKEHFQGTQGVVPPPFFIVVSPRTLLHSPQPKVGLKRLFLK